MAFKLMEKPPKETKYMENLYLVYMDQVIELFVVPFFLAKSVLSAQTSFFDISSVIELLNHCYLSSPWSVYHQKTFKL